LGTRVRQEKEKQHQQSPDAKGNPIHQEKNNRKALVQEKKEEMKSTMRISVVSERPTY